MLYCYIRLSDFRFMHTTVCALEHSWSFVGVNLCKEVVPCRCFINLLVFVIYPSCTHYDEANTHFIKTFINPGEKLSLVWLTQIFTPNFTERYVSWIHIFVFLRSWRTNQWNLLCFYWLEVFISQIEKCESFSTNRWIANIKNCLRLLLTLASMHFASEFLFIAAIHLNYGKIWKVSYFFTAILVFVYFWTNWWFFIQYVIEMPWWSVRWTEKLFC